MTLDLPRGVAPVVMEGKAEIIVVMEEKHQHRMSITSLDMDPEVLQDGQVALEIVGRVVLLE